MTHVEPTHVVQMDWSNAVKDMLAKVMKMTTGGDVLRSMIRDEVQSLQLLRAKLFCDAAEAARQEAGTGQKAEQGGGEPR